MGNYANATKYENELKKKLINLGWKVGRGAGSMGVSDLLAIYPDPVMNLQEQLDPELLPNDLLIGSVKKIILIEVKKTQNEEKFYSSKDPEQWEKMVEHQRIGIPSCYAVRHVSGPRKGRWRIHMIDDSSNPENPPVMERRDGQLIKEVF